MITQEYLDLIEASLKKAKEKHPKFCDTLTNAKLEEAEAMAEIWKRVNDNAAEHNASRADCILQEEIAEAKVEYLKGNKQKAKEEWADAIAVLIRDMEEVDKC